MKFLKNSIYNSYPLLLLYLFLLQPSAVSAQSDTPQFDLLKSQFENNRVFFAEFTHEYNDTFTGEQQRTTGTIWVGLDKYKMNSGSNFMLVENDISRVYDSSKNRVIISEYIEEDDDFAPSRMLQGVDDSFNVNEQLLDNGQTVIRMESEDPFSIFQSVTIYLNNSGVPSRIEAIDQVENELLTVFNNGRFIDEEAGLFEFNYPEDAEWIDLRHDI
tara:strand:+ start:39212 stop:39859 length:648 start_codon:yes stop_codon:yes gene_type:complete